MAPDPTTREVTARLHPMAIELAEALAREGKARVKVVRDEEQRWLAVEETTTAIGFVEAEGDEMRVVPFRGDEPAQLCARSTGAVTGSQMLSALVRGGVPEPGAASPQVA